MYNYTMDPSGNRTGAESYQPDNTQPPSQNISYTYNDDNRLLTAGSTAFTYDTRGNLLTKTGSTYTWNVRNLLNSVTTGGSTYTYKYDPIGNRIARIVGNSETRYVVARGTLLAETNKQGSITAYYVYGLGLISKVTPQGAAYYYHYDNIGSTVAITNQSGAIVNKYAYDAFGKVLSQTEAISNPFKFVGAFGVMDEGNGLLYMRARYYDPSTGRFISKDPIGWAGGLNLYGYTGNNPVNWVDPEGLQYIDINVSAGFWLGGTAGILISPSGTYIYVGGGFVTPGVGGSITWSPSDPTCGWNVGLQGTAVVGGQVGYGFGEDGGWFGEIGIGGSYPTWLGGSLTGYYVFGPYGEKP